MPDDRDKLRETLHALEAQLEEASSLDPAVAERLRLAIGEIEDALAGQPRRRAAEPSLAQRLSEATLEFEASHPTLAGTVGSVIDALGRMGI